MTEIEEINADEGLAKLRTPTGDNHVDDFRAQLATRLGSSVTAEAFYMATLLLTYDLEKGIDGFSGQPMAGRCAGLPPIVYRLWFARVADIAHECFGPEFGALVQTIAARQ